MVSLDRCNGNCNNPYSRICVANKTEDTSLNEFNMIEKINESKTGFDLSFWSAVLKNYPFPTLRWVSKGENI